MVRNSENSHSSLRVTAVRLVLLLLMLPAFAGVTSAQETVKPKRILALYWYSKDFPTNVKFDESLKTVFQGTADGTIEYYAEYLESNRFPGENQSLLLRDYLRQKYADRKIDVLIALSSISLNFLTKYHAELFPNAPIVFTTIDRPELGNQVTGPRITGVITDNAFGKTLDLALKLHPKTERALIIVGTSERDKNFETVVRNSLQRFEDRVALTYLTDLPLDRLLANVRSAGEGSIIFYVRYSREDPGKTLDPFEALSLVTQSARVPVYSTGSLGVIGRGSVGGYGVDLEACATKVAQMSLSIANGKPVQEIPVVVVPTKLTFDWRQLRRWGIREDRLPQDTEVLFREATFWERYKGHILGIAGIIILQTLLIAGLLLERSRRWRATRGLAESEERYRNVVENQTELICRYLPDTTLIFVNDAYCRYFERSRQELLGSRFIERIPPHSRDESLKHLQSIINDRSTITCEHEVILPDGCIGWQQWIYRVISNSDGEAVELQGIGRDITERKHAEQALRETEERNRAILRAIPDLMFLQTRKGIYLDYHAKNPATLLVPPEQFLGKNMSDVLPPEIAAAFNRCFDLAIETGETQLCEYDVEIQGRRRWYEARVAPCNGDKVLSVVRDITERKRAEEALSENEEFNRRIVESSSDCIKILDLEGNLIYMSRNGQRLLEIGDLGPYLNKSWIELWPDEVRRSAREALEQARLGGIGAFQGFGPTAKGRPKWWDTVITPIRGPRGNVERLLAVSRDVTAQKRALEAVRESEERFAKAFNANPQPMSLTTLEEGRYLDVNESFLSMSGYRREEVIGHTSTELRIFERPADRLSLTTPLAKRSSVRNLETKFRTKSGKFRVLLSSAELLDLGGQKCILVASSDITERKSLEEELRLSEREFSTLVQNSPDVISRLDPNLRYIYISPTIERASGIRPDFFIGKTPSEVAPPDSDWKAFEASCREALATGQTVARESVYHGRTYWTRTIPEFTPKGTVESVMTISEDITQRLHQEKELLELTVRLFNLQDEERRRIARELHDGTAQNLFAISINLARLRQLDPAEQAEKRHLIDECQLLGDQSLQEIRTLSYLLHPPLLDQAGLVSALQWYVQGFSKRSGIYVDVTAQPIGRLPSEIETALFRIVQEGLTNVRRHSGSETASIRLERRSNEIVLEIRDRGHGLSIEKRPDSLDLVPDLGVGIPGMRQRLRQLGGRLEISSNGDGTAVAAIVPLRNGASHGAHSPGR